MKNRSPNNFFDKLSKMNEIEFYKESDDNLYVPYPETDIKKD